MAKSGTATLLTPTTNLQNPILRNARILPNGIHRARSVDYPPSSNGATARRILTLTIRASNLEPARAGSKISLQSDGARKAVPCSN